MGATVMATVDVADENGAQGGVAPRAASVMTFTDSAGAFVLATTERMAQVVVYHDALEPYGLSALSATRPSGAAPWQVHLATPSLASVWRTLCGRPPPASPLTTIVFGSLRLDDDTTRLAGATVILGWEPRGMPMHDTVNTASDTLQHVRATTSNARGDYVFCGLPPVARAGLTATDSARHSSAVLLPHTGAVVQRVDVVLGTPARAARVHGSIRQADGLPLRDAVISVDGSSTTTTTGADGRFVLAAVPTGSRMLSARKVGYVPQHVAVHVLARATPAVLLTMPFGVTLDEVLVSERRAARPDVEDYWQRRKRGAGRFLDAAEIVKFPRLQDALRTFSMLSIETAENGVDFVVRGRQRRAVLSASEQRVVSCTATLMNDGIVERAWQIAALPLASIAAIEVHGSGSTAPARYRQFIDDCAVVLVWSKQFVAQVVAR